jgi:hypothetical protein
MRFREHVGLFRLLVVGTFTVVVGKGTKLASTGVAESIGGDRISLSGTTSGTLSIARYRGTTGKVIASSNF